MNHFSTKITALVLALIMVLSLAGCGSSSASEATAAETPAATEAPAVTETPAATEAPAETRTVTDYFGNTAEIPAEVTSICCTIPAADSIIAMLGGGDKLVATSSNNASNPLFALAVPSITSLPIPFTDGSANYEEILSINPDVVVCWSEDDYNGCINAGLTAIRMGVMTIEGLSFSIELMGEILGGDCEAQAQELLTYFNNNIDLVTSRTSDLTDDAKPRVYFAQTSALKTEGANSVVNEWITNAGGVNVAAENGVEDMGVEISAEELVSWDPDVIVCMSTDSYDDLMGNAALSNLTAVVNGNVFVGPKGLYMWTVRSSEEAINVLWAATVINPELFSDIDMAAETTNFYSTFYGMDLTAEQVDTILYPAGK